MTLSKQLRIRLTPEQFRELTKAISKTKKSKSSLVRAALEDFLDVDHCRTEKQNKE
jgi:predicted DNA-binding protein